MDVLHWLVTRHTQSVTVITLGSVRRDYYGVLPSVAAFDFTRVAMHVLPQKFSASRIAIFVSVFCASLSPLTAEQARIIPPAFGAPVFQHLASSSGIIFSGTVTSIKKIETGPENNIGTVQVTFHVEQALRGAHQGQTLVIREWAGLWNSGERYRTGERVALFLFSPGKLGLTSPVGGQLGRFPVDSHGHILLNRRHAAAISADPVLADQWRGRTELTWQEMLNGIRREGRE